MKLLIFLLTYPFIWFISRLPMRVLYFISDALYGLLYYVVGYRKQIVFDNLRLAFPDKNEEQRKRIAKKSFRHFADLIMESVKGFTISEKESAKRYIHKGTDMIDQLAKEGKSIALVGSHQANWEWSVNLSLFVKIPCYSVYTKIQNPYFAKVIKKSRDKFGYQGCDTLIFNKNVTQHIAEHKQYLYLLLSDQSPQLHKAKHWADFLNVHVPVHTGAEILSKRYNFAVVNMNVTQIKRGYYQTDFQLITKSPTDFKDYEITDAYLKITEAHLRIQPELYLWTHKRFKHRGKKKNQHL